MNRTFTISTQPFYDEYNKCYKNILTCNVEPSGPLKQFVRKLRLPKLSPFQVEGPCYPIPKCALAITQFDELSCKCDNLMSPNQMPDLMTFLLSNGYQIETQLTNMLNQSEVKQTNTRLVLMATYYENSQPNITYMR